MSPISAQVKAALQLTSSRVAGAGLIEAGAGSLNVAAAVALVGGKRSEPTNVADIGAGEGGAAIDQLARRGCRTDRSGGREPERRRRRRAGGRKAQRAYECRRYRRR